MSRVISLDSPKMELRREIKEVLKCDAKEANKKANYYVGMIKNMMKHM